MTKPNPNPLQIEQALLGELPKGTVLPDGSEAQIEALRQENQQILDRYPAARIAKEVQRRFDLEKAPQRRWSMVLLPAAAVPLVLAAVLWGPIGKVPPSGQGGDDSTAVGTDTDVQLKGLSPELRIYRKRDGVAPERLVDGSVVHSGEVIQVAYLAAGRSLGVIVSIDGSGNVELHHPASETGAASLMRGTEQPLPKGYKLDAAPRFERFFFVTSKTPGSLDVLQVVAAARSLAAKPDADRSALAVSSALEVSSLTLRKEAP